MTATQEKALYFLPFKVNAPKFEVVLLINCYKVQKYLAFIFFIEIKSLTFCWLNENCTVITTDLLYLPTIKKTRFEFYFTYPTISA